MRRESVGAKYSISGQLYLTLNVAGPGGLCHAMFGLCWDTDVGCTHLAFSRGRKLVEKCYCLPGVYSGVCHALAVIFRGPLNDQCDPADSGWRLLGSGLNAALNVGQHTEY